MSAYSRLVVRRRVLVNLTTGQAIEGVLLRQSGPLLVIVNAILHEPNAEPAPLDGEAVVERDRVAFIQAV